MPQFLLDKKSQTELQHVHKDLQSVVLKSTEFSVQLFSVHDGLRTIDEQKRMVETGASQTMDSRHLTGHAVDLVPLINGKLRWEWQPIFHIGDAVRLAAKSLGIPLRWGGAWDIDFTASTDPVEDLFNDYAARRRKAGKRPFLDGPHFELSRESYP